MTHLIRAGLVTALIGLPASAWAAPPKLTGTSPLGVQRGKTTEITFRGSGLGDNPRLVAPFAFRIEESAGSGSVASDWKVGLTIDAGTAVGIYPIRVVTDWGVSNPILFAVGQVPQLPEVESNNTFDTAQPIPNPIVVEGECQGNDEDFFRFRGRKGDRVVVDALCCRIGSGVDPMIRLMTADGRLRGRGGRFSGLVHRRIFDRRPARGWRVRPGILRFAVRGHGPCGLSAIDRHAPVRTRGAPPLDATRAERGDGAEGGTLSDDRLFAVRTPSDPLLAMFYPTIPARLLGDPAWANSGLDVELPAPVLLGDAADVARAG